MNHGDTRCDILIRKGAITMKIYRKHELCGLLGTSPSSLWRWVRNKSFPAPIQLGPNSVGWIKSEIDEWLAEKAQGRG